MISRNVRQQLLKTKLTGVDYVDHITTLYSQSDLQLADYIGKKGEHG